MRFGFPRRSAACALLGGMLASFVVLSPGAAADQAARVRPDRKVPLFAAAEVADSELVSLVDERVMQWRITAEERPFDAIGWAPDVLEALKLAREHNRPVFLFTYSGRMAVGRC